MSIQKLKITIHGHTFDAEGDPAIVQSQFEVFKELVERIPEDQSVRTSVRGEENGASEDSAGREVGDVEQAVEELDRVMKVEDRFVSLTVRSESVEEAALLLVYGQKKLRDNESVTGAEIKRGLEISGYDVERVDRIMLRAKKKGNILMFGKHRSKRYRLTNRGLRNAEQLAQGLINLVA